MMTLLRLSMRFPRRFPDCGLRKSARRFSCEKIDFDKAVNEAEKVIGYPVSFANLRWLMNDEVANVAIHFRKLVGSEHPILKTAKNILSEGRNNPAWGLLILLVSKAAGSSANSYSIVKNEDIYHSQRALAEITEMIRNGHLIHKGLMNLSGDVQYRDKDSLFFGNKIALLTGDYLLVTANGMLSNLRNQHLSDLMSCALRDLSDSEFVGERNPQNIALPTKPEKSHADLSFSVEDDKIKYLMGSACRFEPLDTSECIGDPVREWTMRNILNGGSLLAKACEGVLYLAKHEKYLQNIAYLLGCHMALAWQAIMDFNNVSNHRTESFSLVSAPVLFALNDDPSLYSKIESAKADIDLVDYEDLRRTVRNGPALNYTMKLFQEHSSAALKLLDNFSDRKAVEAIRNIIVSLGEDN